MIVQCENCETRFHVADARIPEKGARVRCSRCHHRFHITPSSGTSAGPSPAADVSARTATRGDAPAEDELDNPEFLFDGGASESGQTPPRAKGAPRPAPAKQAAAAAPEHEAEPEELKSPSPDLEPAAAPEQHVVETRGKTAQEMLDAGAPKLGSGPVEFAPSLLDPDSDDTRSRVFLGAEGPAAESAPPPSLRPAKDKPARLSPEPDIDAAFGAGASDDEGDSGWDALTKEDPEEPAPPRSVFDAGASFGLVTATATPIAAPPAAAKPARANLFDPAEIQPGDTKKRQAPDAASFDPEAGSPIRGILRVAAVLVGIALLGGALHGLQMQQEASALGTEAEQVAGWIATDVETFVARDSLGVRVLVVRGNLFPNGPAAPPEVDVSLLENDGQRVGEPRRAWLERLDDAEIAPDELSVRLAAHGGELSGAGPQVTGFTALLADPPARARRVQVTLAAGKAPVRGTATAITPRPVTPPAQDSQLAAPESPVERPTPDDAVVPAAPDASD
ncbi:MAG TPA: zinc-ribbon domain-containing protein [Myxococcota bacterium]|nr:zinc-ribbon domain-containing protein [Myxococcota bacterium]